MSLLRVILYYVIAVLLQLTVINVFSIGGITPNLILCLTIIIIFLYQDGYKCMPFALIAMLILDSVSGQYVGISSMSIFLTAILVLILRRKLNVENWRPLLVTGIAANIVYSLSYWIAMRLLGNPMSLMFYIMKEPMYLAYNLLIMMILFFVVSKDISIKSKKRYDK